VCPAPEKQHSYSATPSTLLTHWAGDRLLVFQRQEEQTHIISWHAGEIVTTLLTRGGVPATASELLQALALDEADHAQVEQLLTDLHAHGIIQQCQQP